MGYTKVPDRDMSLDHSPFTKSLSNVPWSEQDFASVLFGDTLMSKICHLHYRNNPNVDHFH